MSRVRGFEHGPSHAGYLATHRFASLDGLRCLSILPVIWQHSTPRQLSGVLGQGPLGVHLFFAISGFLITTLLLRERDRAGQISLSGFWARRSLRIFPLYYAVLLLYTLRGLLWLAPGPMRDHFFRSLPFYASYTGNWFVDYGVAHPVIFGFSWSLATEEQFYLLWPLVLRWCRGFRAPMLITLGLLALDLGAERGLFAFALGSDGPLLRVVTSISAPICLGALAACALHSPRGFRWLAPVLARRASAPAAFALLAVFVATSAPLLCIHIAMVALTAAVSLRPDHGLEKPLDWAPVRHIGVVSYGIYLLHVSSITAVKKLVPSAGAFGIFLLATVVSVALASASHRWFEQPFLAWRERFRAETPPTPARIPAI